jgi:hypothetical protein
MCHGEYYPHPFALYKWWSFSIIGNKGNKKVNFFHFFFGFPFLIFFPRRLICESFNNNLVVFHWNLKRIPTLFLIDFLKNEYKIENWIVKIKHEN